MPNQLNLNRIPRKKPIALLHQPTHGIGFLGCYVDEKGDLFFNADDVAKIAQCSRDHILEQVHQEFGDRLEYAICRMSMGRAFDEVNGIFIATPCLKFLLDAMPQLAALRGKVSFSNFFSID